MTEHSSVHTLSGAYAVDALNDEERAVFEEHLPGCLDCRAEVAGLREAAALLAEVTATAPPGSLRAGVLAGIATIRPLPPEVESAAVLPLRRRFRLGGLAAAAAILAVVGVGGVVVDQLREGESTQQISAADRVLLAGDAQRFEVAMTGGKATVYRSMSRGKAVLVAENMPSLPNGKAYALWLQDSEGTMVPAGMLRSGGDHKQLLRGDAASARAAAISVEPAGGSKTPTTNPVAVFDFSAA